MRYYTRVNATRRRQATDYIAELLATPEAGIYPNASLQLWWFPAD
jgi:hypothetical protein